MQLHKQEVPTYLAQLSSPNWLDRLAAVSALKTDSDDPTIRAALIPLLQDRSDTVRQLAAVTLKAYDDQAYHEVQDQAQLIW